MADVVLIELLSLSASSSKKLFVASSATADCVTDSLSSLYLSSLIWKMEMMITVCIRVGLW